MRISVQIQLLKAALLLLFPDIFLLIFFSVENKSEDVLWQLFYNRYKSFCIFSTFYGSDLGLWISHFSLPAFWSQPSTKNRHFSARFFWMIRRFGKLPYFFQKGIRIPGYPVQNFRVKRFFKSFLGNCFISARFFNHGDLKNRLTFSGDLENRHPYICWFALFFCSSVPFVPLWDTFSERYPDHK